MIHLRRSTIYRSGWRRASRWMLPLFLGLATCLQTAPLWGNAAQELDYLISVDGNDVVICPIDYDGDVCTESSDMIREDVDSGEVVLLAEYCVYESGGVDPECNPDTEDFCVQYCYKDECVPAGNYRYGYVDPYDCGNSAAWVAYYNEAVVKIELSNACQRSEDNEAPEMYEAKPPWADMDNRYNCRYQDVSDDGAGSCRKIVANELVLAFNFLMLIFALVWWRARA